MTVIQSGIDIGLNPELKPDINSSVKAEEAKKNESISTARVIKQKSKATNDSQSLDSQPLKNEQLKKVAQQLQDFVGELNKSLEFSVDEDSGRDVIKVFDKDTGDLIKQFPSEEVLTLVSKLSEMVGGLVDAKV